MAQQKSRWIDVITEVETANLRDMQLLKDKEREINRKYLDKIGQDIANRKYYNNKRVEEQREERATIERLATEEKEKIRAEKSMKMGRELKYQKDNKDIITQLRLNQQPEQAYIESPFMRLMEESDRRKQAFREKLKAQNQVNRMQEEMKHERIREYQEMGKMEMDQYSNKIESYYEQRNRNRSDFKNRYLKLNRFESDSIKSQKKIKPHPIEQDYLLYLDHQVNLKQRKNQERELLDEQLSKFNRNIEHNGNSPAFLGKTPVSHDRKKQLFYLDRSINQARPSHTKTEGDQISFTVNKQSSKDTSKQINQINKTIQVTIDNKRQAINPQTNSKPSPHNIILTPIAASKSYSSINPGESKKKQYMKFDIIQGKNKFIAA